MVRNYTAGDAEINSELIDPMLIKDFEKLVLRYGHLKDIGGKISD
jgi:hypothetical protein